MVNSLYYIIDILCFIILSIILVQNKNKENRNESFTRLIFYVCTFCLVDCFWGIVASDRNLAVKYLKLVSTLFYLFAAGAACAWVRFIITYTELLENSKFKKLIDIVLYIPLTALFVILVVNWNKGILFYEENGEYFRGPFKYVLITYILHYTYYVIAMTFAFVTSLRKYSKKIKSSIYFFTLIPVLAGIMQLRHADQPHYAIGFMLSCFIIFIFDVISEREKAASQKIQYQQLTILNRCNEIIENHASVEENVSALLKFICEWFDADRVLLHEIDKEKQTLTCNYEWNKETIPSSKNRFKNVPINEVNYWLDLYMLQDQIEMEDISKLKNKDEKLYRNLCESNVKSFISFCLKIGNQLIGFLVVENPKIKKDTYLFFKIFSIYLYSEILRRKKIEQEEKTSGAVVNVLSEDYISVLHINLDTDKMIVYRNNSRVKNPFRKYKELNFSYTDICNEYIDKMIVEDEREEMHQFCSIENLKSQLKNRKIIKKQYKCYINGEVVYYQAKWVKVEDIDSDPVIVILAFEDINDQIKNIQLISEQKKEIEKKQHELSSVIETVEDIKRKSEIDKLTGLYNKISGQQIIQKYLNTKDNDEAYTILFIDIDNFKNFNDLYGHLVGDEVLITVGKTISNYCRRDDIAVRFGGDEFVVLMKGLSNAEVVKNKADAMRKELKNLSATKEFMITCSIGIAITKNSDYEFVINKADEALYTVKKTTRDDIKIFNL